MKSFFVFFLMWLCLFFVGYWIGSLAFDTAHLEYMTREGKGVYGRVVSKEPDNHRIVRYTYVVDGTEYAGSGHGGFGNPEFEEIKIGDKIVAYYDPAHQNESIMGNPWYDLGSKYTGIYLTAFVLSVFPMVIILAIYFGTRLRRKPITIEGR